MVMNEIEFKLKFGTDYAVSYVMPFAKRIIMTPSDEEVYMFVNSSGYVECIGGVIPATAVPEEYIFHLGHENREMFKWMLEAEIDQYIENVLTRRQRIILEKYSDKYGICRREAFSTIYAEGRLYVEREVWESMKCKIVKDIHNALRDYYYDEAKEALTHED